jgi:hypothetical protein
VQCIFPQVDSRLAALDYRVDKNPLDPMANQLNLLLTFAPYLRCTLITFSHLSERLLVLISSCEGFRRLCF